MGATRVGIKRGAGGRGLAVDEKTNPWWVEASQKGLLPEAIIGLEIAPANVQDPDTKRSPGGKLTIG